MHIQAPGKRCNREERSVRPFVDSSPILPKRFLSNHHVFAVHMFAVHVRKACALVQNQKKLRYYLRSLFRQCQAEPKEKLYTDLISSPYALGIHVRHKHHGNVRLISSLANHIEQKLFIEYFSAALDSVQHWGVN